MLLQPSEQLKRDATRLRRFLTGRTVCIDCGTERAIGARECMACRRCCSCGQVGCYREVCADDAGIEAETHNGEYARYSRVAALVFAGWARPPTCKDCGQPGHDGCVPAPTPERTEEVRDFVRWESSLGRTF